MSSISTSNSSFYRLYPFNSEALPAVAGGALSGIGISKMIEPSNLPIEESVYKRSPAGLFYKNLKEKKYIRAGGRCGYNTIVTPIVEECLFRGYLYPLNKTKSGVEKVKDIATNSALFAAAHFDPRAALGQTARVMPRAFAAGVIFGALAEETSSLWAPTAAHITANALGFYKLAARK